MSAPGQLSCPVARFCAAATETTVDQETDAGVSTFDGSSWSVPAVRASRFRDGIDDEVSCAGRSFCLAVFDTGSYVTWNGSTWSPAAPLPAADTDGPNVLSCPSPTFCMLANGGQWDSGSPIASTYATFDGHGWSGTRRLPNVSVSAAFCTSASFCVAAGGEQITANGNIVSSYDMAMTWDGTSWGAVTDLGSALGPARAVSCATTHLCMTVGGYHASGDEYTLWNGAGWSAERPDTTGTGISPLGFSDVSCPVSFCVATDWGSGANGAPSTARPPVLALWHTGTWTAESVGGLGGDVSCASDTYCVVVDGGRYAVGTS